MSDNDSPRTFVDLLTEMREKPYCWVARRSLPELQSILGGYQAALCVNRIDPANQNFSNDFAAYLREHFDWPLSYGWGKSIELNSESEDPWNHCFELMFDFIETRDNAGGQLGSDHEAGDSPSESEE